MDYHKRAHDKIGNCKFTGQVMGYINRIKHITQKLLIITDSDLLDQYIMGLCPSILKEVQKRTQIPFKKRVILLKDAHAWMH